MFRTILPLVVIAAVVAPVRFAQSRETDKTPPPSKLASGAVESVVDPEAAATGHVEVPNDPYVSVPRGGRATSPAVRWTRGGYVAIQVNVNANGDNIVGDAGNEPSIAVDVTNPNRMAIGWRQFDMISSDFRQAGWGYTADAGQTWTFPGVIEPGVFRSDPVLDADAQGNFYYNSLTANASLTDFWCHVYKSTDGGATWDAGTYAYGGDKQWMAIDRTNGIGQGNIYASWNSFYSACSGHFTRSYDNGQSFLPCTSAPGSPYWGTLAVGPDGELYLSGTGFAVVKSSNMQDSVQSPVWELSTTVNLDGSIGYSTGPNPGGLLGQNWIAVDHSDGPNRGNVYMLCSVSRNSTPDPMDVMFARSTNGGQNWSAPIRINDDPGTSAWQWFGTMSVAPNGRIDAIWLDTRNDPGGYDSELYYSFSDDGGLSWSANDVLTPSFDPHVGWPQQNKMGDYFHMVSDDAGANLAFAATFNGEQDVYYMRIGDPACPRAGTISLDRPKYACDGTASIRVLDCDLNTNDGAVETLDLTIDSTSEPAGEIVLLTETGPATGQFAGSIELSTADSTGVLWINEGDVVTGIYIDADDGEGGTNIVVTDSAVVDCTSPIISNVQATDVGPRDASITFDTDEAAAGSVRYGSSCGALTETASQNGYLTNHSVYLTDLGENNTYFYAVDAEDEAGNPASDDNGGACYTFTTTDIPDYFTEEFGGDNDLDNISLTFTPNGSGDYYSGCAEPITELPTDPAGGTTLPLSDDDSQQVNLSGGATVSFYGISYGTFYPGSNGYLTFGSGDTDYTESLDDHFDMPRISAIFDDLNPSSAGTVSWKQLADRAVVTWENVPEYGTSNPNTFQVELHFDGTIVVSYLAMSPTDGIAGLSAGGGTPDPFYENDLSNMGSCGDTPPTAQSGSASTAYEIPVTITLLATDDGMPDPPAALEYIIANLPSSGTLSDPGAGAINSAPYTLASGGNQVVYLPDAAPRAVDSFQFQANDGGSPPEGGDSNVATITINIGGPAWDPVAYDVNDTTAVSLAKDVTLDADDPNGDPLTYHIQSLPADGFLSDPGAGNVPIDAVPYELANSGQVVTYQPPCGQALVDTFTYSAKDATAWSNTATVDVTITALDSRRVYNFPMDSDPGWSADASWAFGQPTGGGTHNNDPISGATGNNVYGYNLSGDYTNDLSERYLTTLAIDCSSLTDTELRFQRWLGVQRFDEAGVEVSNNGTDWVQIWLNPQGNPVANDIDDSAWSQQALDISSTADGQATIYVRWVMGATDSAVTFPGWNIDDVEIWGIVPIIAADFNGDGLVNQGDAAKFIDCLSGPDVDKATACLCVDLDGDGDVDLGDFAEFQTAY